MRLVLLAVSTSTRPSQVWSMLAVSQETGAHHRMEKSNSLISSRSRDRFWVVARDPQVSGNQLWRGTIQRRGAIIQVASARLGTEISSWLCKGGESGLASTSPMSYLSSSARALATWRQSVDVSVDA